MERDSALLIVDLQVDLCPGGAVGIARGDEVVPLLNEWIDRFDRAWRPIVVTRYCHPATSAHFREQGGPWPPHCVQGTAGAEFHPRLVIPKDAIVISRGMEPDEGTYSAFRGSDERGRPLKTILTREWIRHLYVGGLGTESGVAGTVKDALRGGFDVTVIEDAIRAVNVDSGDEKRAKLGMWKAGARFV